LGAERSCWGFCGDEEDLDCWTALRYDVLERPDAHFRSPHRYREKKNRTFASVTRVLAYVNKTNGHKLNATQPLMDPAIGMEAMRLNGGGNNWMSLAIKFRCSNIFRIPCEQCENKGRSPQTAIMWSFEGL